jgi:hypothetical protein
VADNQIKYLATRSEELDQETRVSVYTFNTAVRCLIYDKDVLRLPSLKGLYKPSGMTALVDATIKSQEDLAATAQLYGDHAFLTYVITDGAENASKRRKELKPYLDRLPENWTVALLVPDASGAHEAKKFGFPADNIAIWDANSAKGFEEAGKTIRQATDNFMQARSTGNFRGTRGLFDMSAANLTKDKVTAALKPLPKGHYHLVEIGASDPVVIKDFVWRLGIPYELGKAYYQLSKTEKIQPQKNICVVDKKTKKVYAGAQARDILGLPSMEVKVSPQQNPDYLVFVQSTSVNRKLVPGTKLLVMDD